MVGGIGIMNMMLMPLRERTHEIGLRKAVGARDRDILSQFIIEALAMATGGGLIGVLIGALIAFIVVQSGNPATITFDRPRGRLYHGSWPLLRHRASPPRRPARPIAALRYE